MHVCVFKAGRHVRHLSFHHLKWPSLYLPWQDRSVIRVDTLLGLGDLDTLDDLVVPLGGFFGGDTILEVFSHSCLY
jgi:hypothetical protein